MSDNKMMASNSSRGTGSAKRRPRLKQLLLTSAMAGAFALVAPQAGAEVTWYTLDSTTSTVQKVGLNVSRLGNPVFDDLSTLGPGPALYDWTAVTFTAAETGFFFFGQTRSPVDTVMIFYNGVFDPADPGRGAMNGNDDTPISAHEGVLGPTPLIVCGPSPTYCPQVHGDIEAGRTYTLFISVYSPTDYTLELPLNFYSTASVSFRPYTGRHPIDLDAPFYVASQLGITVDPDFVGGTLKMDEEGRTYSQGFTLANIESSSIEMNGKHTTFTGVFSDAATSPTGHITFKDSVGGGSVIFGGNNTYTGKTTIESGLVKAGAANVFATSSAMAVASAGTLDLNGYAQRINNLSGAGSVILGSVAITENSTSDTAFSGVVSGTGALTKTGAGSFTLSGNNSYSGGTTISAGKVVATNGSALGSGAVANNAALELNFASDSSLANRLSGTGSLSKTGAGNARLTATGSSQGAVSVDAGTLTFAQAGAFNAASLTTANNATTALTSGATLALTGLLTQNSGSTLSIALGSDDPSITAQGATLSGTLNISGFSGSAFVNRASELNANRRRIISTTGGITGDFTTVNLDGSGTGVDYISLLARRSEAGFDYEIGWGLNWFMGARDGHGTFTLADGASFDADVILSNQSGSFASGWDGKTLTKAGAGTLTLSAANTYTGDTNVNGGTLKTGINNAFATSANVAVASGATLDLNNFSQTANNLSGAGSVKLGSAALTVNDSVNTTLSGAISGTGSLTKTGAGALTLSGNNSYSGGTTISAGKVVATSGSALGSGAVANNAALELAFATDGTFANTLSGTGSLTKTGAGNARLTSAGSREGAVSVDAGTLTFAQAGAFNAASLTTANNATTVLAGGATLALTGALTQNAAATLDVTLGSGPSVTAGSASLGGTLNIVGFSGDGGSAAKASEVTASRKTVIRTTGGISGDFTSVNFGTVDSSADYVQLSVGKSLDNKDYDIGFGLSWLAGPAAGHGTFTLADGASFDVDVALSDQSGSFARGWDGKTLTKAGAGTLTLSAANTYSGSTDIDAGTLKAGVANAFASSSRVTVASGAVLDLNGYAEKANNLGGAGNVALGSGALTVNSTSDTTLSGVVSGTGSLTKTGAGSFTLAGNNSYSGGTTISAGKVVATNGSALGSGAVANNAALELLFASDGTFANTLSGTGSLSKTGAGNARLTSAGSREGAVSVDGGTLTFAQAGAFNAASLTTANNATTALAGGATLALTGALTQNSAATLDVTLGSGPSVTAGSASLGGTLNIVGFSGDGGSAAKASEVMASRKTVIRTTGGITGDFASVNFGTVGSSPGYVQLSAGKSLDNKDYDVGFILSWFAGHETGHGGFDIADGAAFDVDVALSDQTTPFTSGWDGRDLSKGGRGTLTLSAVNDYSGRTIVKQGTLRMGTANAIVSSGSVELDRDTTFDLNGYDQQINLLLGEGTTQLGSGDLSIKFYPGRYPILYVPYPGAEYPTQHYQGRITGTGSVTIENLGTGTYQLDGVSDYSGGTRLVAGKVAASNGSAFGSGAIANNAALELAFASDSTLANRLSGTGSLTKTGAGNARLTSAGSSQGAVAVNAGTLTFAQAGAFNAASLTTANNATTALAGGATVALTGALTQNSAATLDVTLGSGPSITAGSASLGGTLNIAGFSGDGGSAAKASDVTASRKTVIHTTGGISGDFARVNLGTAGSSVDYVQLSAGKSLDSKDYDIGFGLSWLAGPAAGHGTFTLADSASFDVDVALSNQSGSFASGWDGKTLTKAGAGTLTLSAANTYSGSTNIDAGTLKAGVANAFASSSRVTVASGAVLDLNGYAEKANNLGGAGNVALGSGALTVNSTSDTTLSGVVSGTGSLTKTGAGSFTLAGNNSYSGGTTISAGKVVATNGSALGTGAVANNAALELALASNSTLANRLSGTGSLTKTGAGDARLTSAGSSQGAVSVDAGTLTFAQAGAFNAASLTTANNATTALAGGATVALTGALTQNAAATLDVTLGSGPSVTAASALLGGTLNVAGFSGDGAVAKASEVMASRKTVIHTTGGLSGDFDTVAFGLGAAPGSDYVTLAGWKSDDEKDYTVGFGLTWHANASKAHGTFNIADAGNAFDVDVALADRAEAMASGWDGKSLTKTGEGKLVLSADNTYSGGTTFAGGTVQVSSDANLGAASGGLAFDGGTLATTDSFASARTVAFKGRGTFDVADDTVLTLTGTRGGAGGLTKTGAGTLALDGSADYRGDTVVSKGRVEAVRANVLSASSNHIVQGGATLSLNGYDQSVAGLANAGEVRVGGAGGRAGTTLTVGGTYVSAGGSLYLNTVLGTDDSATDRLVTGSVVLAGAATRVFITNVGGLGDYTTGNGIRIVEVGDAAQSAAGAFVLGERVAAGAYEYHLFQDGAGAAANDGNWYLRNQRPEEPTVQDIRPEVPLAMAIPPLATEYGYALLDTRHQRFAETSVEPLAPAFEERTVPCKDARKKNRCVVRTPVEPTERTRVAAGVWSRLFGTRGTQDRDNFLRSGPDYNYTFGGAQAGFDVYARERPGGSLDRAGIYVGYGQISSKVKGAYGGKAGTVDMDAYSVAAYWTHQEAQGWYTDAVVQGTWYSADARSVLGQQVKPDGFGVAISAEGGYAVSIGEGLNLEPQAQLVYQTVSFDDIRDRYGFAVFDKGDSLRGRIGARLAKTWAVSEGERPRQITTWIRANLWHEFLGDGKTTFTDIDGGNPLLLGSPLRGTWAEIGAGVSGQVSDSTTLFLNGAYNRSLDNKGREAWDGRVGVNVKW